MFLYHIGDKVVYPMHGAGVIEAIEEKEILGEKQEYYVLNFPIGEMRVMVPVNSARNVGIRKIIRRNEFDKVIQLLAGGDTDGMSANWNRRYRANLDKIKSGDIYEVADVVRNLMLLERNKGLSTGEKKMLSSAKQILISELVLAGDVDETQIEEILDNIS